MPSHFITLTDPEVAVTVDSLAQMRDFIRNTRPDIANSYGTPNLDAAISKIESLIGPGTAMLYVMTEEGRDELDRNAYHQGVDFARGND